MHTSSDFDTLLFSMEKETSLSLAYSARGFHLTCWWHIKDQITVMNTCVLMNSTFFCIIFSWAGSITADTFSTSEYFYGTSLILTWQIPNIDFWALASLIGGGEGILLCGPRSHSITSSSGPHYWPTLLCFSLSMLLNCKSWYGNRLCIVTEFLEWHLLSTPQLSTPSPSPVSELV